MACENKNCLQQIDHKSYEDTLLGNIAQDFRNYQLELIGQLIP